jgi:hypothetical protein
VLPTVPTNPSRMSMLASVPAPRRCFPQHYGAAVRKGKPGKAPRPGDLHESG